MSLYQGLIGAQSELSACRTTGQKLHTAARITKIFGSEIIGTLQLAPFGYAASKLHRSLPAYPLDSASPAAAAVGGVCLARGVPYAPGPHQLMDIYVPVPQHSNSQQQEQPADGLYVAAGPAAGATAPTSTPSTSTPAAGGAPVVLFCHGGVWAAGERWHYSPLAARLAQLGVVACVVSYTLYPDALLPQMVEEVSAAFGWVLDHAAEYGGDPGQVSLVGHSAGAHLCQMALLHRAAAAHAAACVCAGQRPPGSDAACKPGTSSSSSSSSSRSHGPLQLSDPRMPLQFVAITGVYDIAAHYEYERQRGVHELSTMKRAMGGKGGFADMSPAVILRDSLYTHQHQQQQHHHQQQQKQPEAGPGSRHTEGAARPVQSQRSLAGEVVAARVGFERVVPGGAAQLHSPGGNTWKFPLPAAAYLPPTVLISSCTDITVPWYESAEMYWHLYDAGVPVKHLVYNKVGHGDFVVNWPWQLGQLRPPLQQQQEGEVGAPGAAAVSSCEAEDGWGEEERAAAADADWGCELEAAAGPAVATSSRQEAGGLTATPLHNLTDTSTSSGGSSRGLSPLTAQQEQLLDELPPYNRDIALLVLGAAPVDWACAPRDWQGAQEVLAGKVGAPAAPEELLPAAVEEGMQEVVVRQAATAAAWLR